MTQTPHIGRYSTREQTTVLRALVREHGQQWARDLTRVEYNDKVLAALVDRYGVRCPHPANAIRISTYDRTLRSCDLCGADL